MDRAAYQAWLKTLAAEDRRRRKAAEPELERKEEALDAARRRLAASEEAIADLEAALQDAGREANGLDGD